MTSGWMGPDRRSNGQKEQFKEAVIEAAVEFWADEERVQRVVHMLVDCFQREFESGAGKIIFKGVRRLFWALLIAAILLFFGGWQLATSFLKTVIHP